MMYLVALNTYRSSTDDGFSNTWYVAECESKAHQIDVLANGLEVRDVCTIDNYGVRSPVVSTRGIRRATRAERREYKRMVAMYGNSARECLQGPKEIASLAAADATLD